MFIYFFSLIWRQHGRLRRLSVWLFTHCRYNNYISVAVLCAIKKLKKSPVDCEIKSMIRFFFFFAKQVSAVDIHSQIHNACAQCNEWVMVKCGNGRCSSRMAVQTFMTYRVQADHHKSQTIWLLQSMWKSIQREEKLTFY